MPKRSLSRMPIDERLRIAGQLAVRAQIFYDTWRYYYDALNEEGNAHYVMNYYSEFFRFDQHSHLVAFLIHTSALLEKRSDTINLPYLLAELNKAALLTAAMKTEAGALLTKVLAHRASILLLRNNLFAHRSASLRYNDAFRKAAITPNQLRTSIQIILKLSNKMLFSQGLKDNIANDLPVVDIKAVHKALYQHHVLGLAQ